MKGRDVVSTGMVLMSLLGGELGAGAGTRPQETGPGMHPVFEELRGPAPAGASAVPFAEPELQRFPVGTRGSDVREMLSAVREGRRADIEVPEAFGDVAVEVETRWLGGQTDWNHDGVIDPTLLRVVRVPDLDEKLRTVAWLVAVPAAADGSVGPDEEKRGVVLWAGMAAGPDPSFEVEALEPAGPAVRLRIPARDGLPLRRLEIRLASGHPAASQSVEADRALVQSAALVFDRMVLAPETAYVKAFIRKEFQAEVDLMEAVRGLAIPEVLRPLYSGLKGAATRLAARQSGPGDAAWLPRLRDAALLLAREADLALALSSDEYRYRVDSLASLSKRWREMESGLKYKDEPMRRIDFEKRISETAGPKERLALARAYEGAFSSQYEEGGAYEKAIAGQNEIARRRGYRSFADLRLEEVFGIEVGQVRAWIEEAFATTEAPARAFIEELRKQKGGCELGYWEVSYLEKAWLKRRLGVEELPTLSEQQARVILKLHLADLGFRLDRPPYDRITMDYYEDPLKLTAGGVAAAATERESYFTSNLKPGQPIPLDEYETVVHETLHTLHYQTSGEASRGSSAFQNLMYSYIAEGIAMSGQGLPMSSPALMRRYFGELPGFSAELMETYPQVRRRANAWSLRRLLVMALMEINLYEARQPDGSERPWKERLAHWKELIASRLWVVPDGIELGQILCRMHPTAEQHQLMYASYPLGRILVGQLRDAIVEKGGPEELKRYGEYLRRLMARGALADQPFVKELIAEARRGGEREKAAGARR